MSSCLWIVNHCVAKRCLTKKEALAVRQIRTDISDNIKRRKLEQNLLDYKM